MIVNPASDSGRTAKAWPKIAAGARARGLECEVATDASAPGHATELTREALREGATLIIAVGGDGTVSEVANGFFDGERAVAPAGRARRGRAAGRAATSSAPSASPSAPIARSTSPPAASRARSTSASPRFTGPDGEPAERLFVNVASAGMTGYAAEKANASSKRAGRDASPSPGPASSTLIAYTNRRMRVTIDGERARAGLQQRDRRQLPQLGRRNEDPADGRARRRGARRARLGRHLEEATWCGRCPGSTAAPTSTTPRRRISRAREVTVAPEQPLPIELDGELPGTTPATFTLRPQALRLRVPA